MRGIRLQMGKISIFISHCQEDEDFCRVLVSSLRSVDADVWYDEHNLETGQLIDTIQYEIERRPVFIIILSRAAFQSRWVRREAKWAYELADRDPARIILPVTAKPIDRKDFSGEVGWLFLADFK